jgi:hypothetical protein
MEVQALEAIKYSQTLLAKSVIISHSQSRKKTTNEKEGAKSQEFRRLTKESSRSLKNSAVSDNF